MRRSFGDLHRPDPDISKRDPPALWARIFKFRRHNVLAELQRGHFGGNLVARSSRNTVCRSAGRARIILKLDQDLCIGIAGVEKRHELTVGKFQLKNQAENFIFCCFRGTIHLIIVAMITHTQFLDGIERFLTLSGMSARKFGVESVNDPRFVRDIRAGRSPTLTVVERVDLYINNYGKPKRGKKTA